MDKLLKLLRKLTQKERGIVEDAITHIISDSLHGYDVKKLKGHTNVYRVRVGSIRIIFIDEGEVKRIIDIGRRSENTYRDY